MDPMTITVDDRELIARLERESRTVFPERMRDGHSYHATAHALGLAKDRLQSLLSIEQRVRTFLAKLDECSPHIDSAFLMMEMHSGPYRGPDYGTELAELRAALTQTEVP
jgi:hypothetical protein